LPPNAAPLGQEMATHANELAQSHERGHRDPGSYDSMDFGGPQRPRTYVRVADARGALDEALHGTLTEALMSAKGRRV
jgi:hypothetical protein